MLTRKLQNFLQEEGIEVLPEVQDTYAKLLTNLGLTKEVNEDFMEFMTKYSNEHYGSIGFISDVMNDDLSDIETGYSHQLWEHGVPKKYISLFNGEVDDYLLYNRENDHVVLVEGGDMDRLLSEEYDEEWDSFGKFLLDFFELE